MDEKEFFATGKLLTFNFQITTIGNVPHTLQDTGDDTGSAAANQKNTGWTLQQHYDLCIAALSNNATMQQVDAYCQANCHMSFGFLFSFIQVLNNPVTFD